MTTADTSGVKVGGCAIPVGVFKRVCMGMDRGGIWGSYGKVEADEAPVSSVRWWDATVDAVCGLPWGEFDLRDGRKPLDPVAVGDMLLLLREVLTDSTLPPTSIIPTWRGGVTAEWHVNGFDLEVGSDPDGTKTYFFAGPVGPESEGLVSEGLEELKLFVTQLPAFRE